MLIIKWSAYAEFEDSWSSNATAILLLINSYIALKETFKGAIWISLSHISF